MAALGLHCCTRAFSSCSEQGLLFHCGSWAFYCVWSTGSRHPGSVAVEHRLSCSMACGIFPDQRGNMCSLHWQANSQLPDHQGNPAKWKLPSRRDFWFLFGVLRRTFANVKLALGHEGIGLGLSAPLNCSRQSCPNPWYWPRRYRLQGSPLAFGEMSPKISHWSHYVPFTLCNVFRVWEIHSVI